MKMTKYLCVISIFIALISFSGCSKKELNYTVSEVNSITGSGKSTTAHFIYRQM